MPEKPRRVFWTQGRASKLHFLAGPLKVKLVGTNSICSSLYGFKLERLPLAVNAADKNRHSTNTLEDAIPR